MKPVTFKKQKHTAKAELNESTGLYGGTFKCNGTNLTFKGTTIEEAFLDFKKTIVEHEAVEGLKES